MFVLKVISLTMIFFGFLIIAAVIFANSKMGYRKFYESEKKLSRLKAEIEAKKLKN